MELLLQLLIRHIEVNTEQALQNRFERFLVPGMEKLGKLFLRRAPPQYFLDDDQYREIALNGVNQFKKVQTLSRDNGTWQDVETNSKGHKTIIKTTLSAATTVTLKIFKE